MYPGYPAYSTPPASSAYPPRPTTAVGTGPSYPAPMPSVPDGVAPLAPASPVPSTAASLSQSQRRALEVTLAVLRSAGLFALCFLGVVIALGSRFAHEQVLKESHPLLDAAGILMGLVLLVAVFLRRRWPVTITIGSALAGIAAALDTTLGLIAFTTVVRRPAPCVTPCPGPRACCWSSAPLWRSSATRVTAPPGTR